MRATFTPKDWMPALKYVGAVVPKKVTIPTLACVRVEVSADGRVRLSATDLDMSLTATVMAEVDAPDIAVVPYERLATLLGRLSPDTKVTITTEGEHCLVVAGRGRWRLSTLPSADWPELPGPGPTAAHFTLAAADARRLVARTGPTVCTDGVRFYLNGVFWCRVANQLVCVSTDGNRLGRVAFDLDPNADLRAIVSTLVVETLDVLAKHGDDIDVRIDQNKIQISCGPYLVVSKLIDGTYPDYGRVIPQPSANCIEVNNADLIAAAERHLAVATSPPFSIGLAWGDDGVLSTCLAANESVGAEELATGRVSGMARVALQAHYLLDALQALGGKTVVIDHGNASEPVRISNPADVGSVMIIMPIRWREFSAPSNNIK